MNNVDHPNHYNQGNIEVIDIIEDWKLDFNEGNVLKYFLRAKHKGKPIEDIDKAIWYLNRLRKRYEPLEIKPRKLETIWSQFLKYNSTDEANSITLPKGTQCGIGDLEDLLKFPPKVDIDMREDWGNWIFMVNYIFFTEMRLNCIAQGYKFAKTDIGQLELWGIKVFTHTSINEPAIVLLNINDHTFDSEGICDDAYLPKIYGFNFVEEEEK